MVMVMVMVMVMTMLTLIEQRRRIGIEARKQKEELARKGMFCKSH